MTLSVSEMPTLSLLYKQGSIPSPRIPDGPDPEGYPFAANASLNDKICLIQYDITKLEVDAIVNAANSRLQRGGGVDGAIHHAAGPGLQLECDKFSEDEDGVRCETGDAKKTSGLCLPARHIIHAVGPIFYKSREQECRDLLKSCYRRCLEIAVEGGLKSIAFSALSTGIYGYPSTRASEAALEAVREFLETGNADDMTHIIFCNFMDKDVDAYYGVIAHYFPPVAQTDEAEPEAILTNEAEPNATLTGEAEPNMTSIDEAEPNSTSTNEAELTGKLPDAPTTEPEDTTALEEPMAKKQKTDVIDDDYVVVDDNYVVVEKEDAAPDENRRSKPLLHVSASLAIYRR